MGTRREGRILALQILYAYESKDSLAELFKFEWAEQANRKPSEESRLFSQFLVTGVLENLENIDNVIKENLHRHDFARIEMINLALLRLSIYSILYQKDIPYQVIINEAIDLAKDFSTEDAFKFINALLDSVARKQ